MFQIMEISILCNGTARTIDNSLEIKADKLIASIHDCKLDAIE